MKGGWLGVKLTSKKLLKKAQPYKGQGWSSSFGDGSELIPNKKGKYIDPIQNKNVTKINSVYLFVK